ncbi:MAG: transcriptional regulator [bacterium]|nr:transcriptional regulator [bacterium]
MVAIKPSTVVGRLLRRQRTNRRLTLKAVSDGLAELGEAIPQSTLSRIEHGQLDPGIRRLYALLRYYSIPPHLIADLVELESLSGSKPPRVPDGDLQKLYDRGIEFWRAGDVANGLAYLTALRDHVPDTEQARELKQRAAIAFATAARNLGKFHLAKQIVDDVLCEPPVPTMVVPALVLASSLWSGLGALDVAIAMVRRAEDKLEPGALKDRAWVLHQKAKLLLEDGRPEEAARDLRRAMDAYRRIGDTWGTVRAYVLRVEICDARGQAESAVRSARKAIALSEKHGHARGTAYARLELGRLHVKAGDVEDGIAELNRGLGDAVLTKDRNAQFYAHYQLWKAFDRSGDSARAEFEFGCAARLVQHVDEPAAEVIEVTQRVEEKGDVQWGRHDGY